MDLQQLQEIQFETLKDIASVCDKHGIRYSIYCGTLLGAVRHKGFIPWDDDVDLAMPLSDYYRFLEVFPREMHDKYDGLTYRTEKNGRCLWYRIYRKNTTYCPVNQLELEIDQIKSDFPYKLKSFLEDPVAVEEVRRGIQSKIDNVREMNRQLEAFINELKEKLRKGEKL